MSFSDWVTIVSIFFAILLAVFKYDEWEIIRLKHYKNFLWLPTAFLILSGMSAYFQTNVHPRWLDFLWSEIGLSSGLWSIIWVICFFASAFDRWRVFTKKRPSDALIKKYRDYLETMDSDKFSSIFRKYEQYFFTSNEVASWEPYKHLLISKKWWGIAPAHFKELVFNKPARFHKMDRNVLKSLLESQLSDLPFSQLGKEISSGGDLSEETPILNIFLSDPSYIENTRHLGLLSTIGNMADEYFSSTDFFERDKPVLSLKPSGNASDQVAPQKTIPYFYIKLIDYYWRQALKTKAQVAIFYSYQTWTQNLLKSAPVIDPKYDEYGIPNLYINAVDRMLSYIHDWIDCLEDEELTDLEWAGSGFIELKGRILAGIQKHHKSKVPKEWYAEVVKQFIGELITCRNLFHDSFNPTFSLRPIDLTVVLSAFNVLTNDDYLADNDKNDEGYQWLVQFLKAGNALDEELSE